MYCMNMVLKWIEKMYVHISFSDRYEVNEQTTRKPNINGDEFYGNTNSLGGDGGNGNGIVNGGVGAGSGNRLGFIAPNGAT